MLNHTPAVNTPILAPRNANHDFVARTMSSREVAELVEARHNDVIATIERLFAKGLLRSSRISRREATGGRPVEVYDLIERDTHLVIAGYSDEHRARVIDRWQELEARQIPSLPSHVEALRLYADQLEENQRVTHERDIAIATKAEIGTRREATAMATASAAVREANRLKAELGRNAQAATIIAVEKACSLKFGKQGFRPLQKWCKSKGITPIKVPCPRYGEAAAWPAQAWLDCYDIDLAEVFGGEA